MANLVYQQFQMVHLGLEKLIFIHLKGITTKYLLEYKPIDRYSTWTSNWPQACIWPCSKIPIHSNFIRQTKLIIPSLTMPTMFFFIRKIFRPRTNSFSFTILWCTIMYNIIPITPCIFTSKPCFRNALSINNIFYTFLCLLGVAYFSLLILLT